MPRERAVLAGSTDFSEPGTANGALRHRISQIWRKNFPFASSTAETQSAASGATWPQFAGVTATVRFWAEHGPGSLEVVK